MQRSLESVPGVSKVSIDFGAKTATATVKNSVKTETLIKALPSRFSAKVKS